MVEVFTNASKTARDIEAVERSLEERSPRPVETRLKNRLVGRALSLVFRQLWRPWGPRR